MGITEKSFDEINHLVQDLNLLIITANDIETFHVRQALQPIPDFCDVIKVQIKNHTYFIGTFGEYRAIHVQCTTMGSMGSGGAILTTADAIDAWKPSVVLMVGVAMGVDESKQRIGDVLICETVISYENQRLGKSKTQYRNPPVTPGTILLDRFKHENGWQAEVEDGSTAVKIIGPILSGEKLIDNLRLRNRIIKQFPNSIGAEMEGAGIHAACKNKNIHEWLIVKGICDYGDGNKGVNKENRQNIAAKCATSLCLNVLMSKTGFVDIGLVAINAKTIDESQAVHKIEESKKMEIVEIIEKTENKENMHSAIQTTVAAFLELSSYQKINVIDELGLSLSSFTNLDAHEMNKEFFRQVKELNLLSKLWDIINKIKPFQTNINPFL